MKSTLRSMRSRIITSGVSVLDCRRSNYILFKFLLTLKSSTQPRIIMESRRTRYCNYRYDLRATSPHQFHESVRPAAFLEVHAGHGGCQEYSRPSRQHDQNNPTPQPDLLGDTTSPRLLTAEQRRNVRGTFQCNDKPGLWYSSIREYRRNPTAAHEVQLHFFR